eukprot:TRINITY_DN9077_c0_g1_i1.p1 TRINITY_DN9077_c0_g1~~TRINITY_DN9077_c0_g1_i1.p1  ORF type:complete len:290 (-),score=58.81 TRINITY_DN9077_c0_g1_i1:403-1272(-)
MAVAICDFWNSGEKDHTFHQGDAWSNEERGSVHFYAFSAQVEGSEPICDFWNGGDKDHTFHAGDAWPNEDKGQVQFYAFTEQKPGTEPVFDFFNENDRDHTFHFGEPWPNETKGNLQFYAYPGLLSYDATASCDGVPAGDRMQWLKDNKGMGDDAAQQQVLAEFPSVFAAGSDQATEKVDGKFPHTLRLVRDARGQSRAEIAVTPPNPETVSLVAVHYGVNSDDMSMNFDIRHTIPGTATYVHTTPDFGPVCEPGSSLKYWIAVEVNGVLQYMPDDAPIDGSRLTWTAS